MSSEIIQYHCCEIINRINKKDYFLITCLNFLIKHGSSENTRHDWHLVGKNLFNLGYLKINSKGEYYVTE